ncbi:MAG TPA: hypothetical protein VN926_10930 [Bradyrhizobium sp.]|jgi:hypothetical protein|nr:hypothetical protein [Bradyrhizobium sp.]
MAADKKTRELLAAPVYLLAFAFWLPTTFLTWVAGLISGDQVPSKRTLRIFLAMTAAAAASVLSLLFAWQINQLIAATL